MAACATAPSFDTPDASFKGRVNVVETPVVVPGTEVKLAGRDFKPGQEIRLTYGGAALSGKEPVVVGADGTFRTQFVVPADAPVGQHPVVVNASKPAAALIHTLKVSPDIPLSGEERFTLTSKPLVPGLYQAAYSAKNDVLFVTSAVGRPPVTQTQLVKVDPQTLAILANVTPPPAPAQPARDGQAPRDPGLYAVYGVAVDDVNGTVWVTNTRQSTVAVYRQSDLALLKQFDAGLVPHVRDVVVDEKQGKVYASAFGAPNIAVFDARTQAFVKNIEIKTTLAGGPGAGDRKFSPMSLELDPENHKLYTVSMSTDEAAVIDTRTDEVDKVFAIEGSKGASGVAFDPRTNRLLVASQGSDNLLIVDLASGKTLHDVKVGAGPLNVAKDSERGVAYVPNRGSGTVTVVNFDGEIVANLPGGTLPNHVTKAGKGTIYAINKARGNEDPNGDRITRITPR
ncbi:ATP-binding protein [Pseudothauera nasutitermitis]|uniref:ATP-binding protein n=2 Tax=Pseudothauera nasutitermitis TaxID=2565930 RepID=A0A4S4AXZ1_9RHOO|nr:ATP-binding protein [Pseudothauera nasutitermitis]